jgi:hypothetical protein
MCLVMGTYWVGRPWAAGCSHHCLVLLSFPWHLFGCGGDQAARAAEPDAVHSSIVDACARLLVGAFVRRYVEVCHVQGTRTPVTRTVRPQGDDLRTKGIEVFCRCLPGSFCPRLTPVDLDCRGAIQALKFGGGGI